MAELGEITQRLGRFPEASDFADGGTLAGRSDLQSWIRNQRRRELDDGQIASLNAIPGFSWAPRDDAWEDRLREYQAWTTREGRDARYRSNDPQERRLADWFARQRRHHDRGLLTHRQVMLLLHVTLPQEG